MKYLTGVLVILTGIIFATALTARPASAQRCTDARGNPVDCVKKKTATPPRATRTPTPPPSLVPSVTPVASPTPTKVPSGPLLPGGNGPQASGFPGGFGWLFGLLVPAVLLMLGFFFLKPKPKGGLPGGDGSDKGIIVVDGKPVTDGSDKMGAQPHMQPGEVGIDDPNI